MSYRRRLTREKAVLEENPRRRDMMMRYMDGETLDEIGTHYGITRERVRQILGPLFIKSVLAAIRERALVEWTCEECGTQKQVHERVAARKYCSRECSAASKRKPSPDFPDIPYAVVQNTDGHWYTKDQFDQGRRGVIRLARYVMQEHLGRRLDRNEWVRHKDGDPDNVSLDNLEVRTPQQVALSRKPRKGAFTSDMVLAGLKSFAEHHGDLPSWTEAERWPDLPIPQTILRKLHETSWPVAMRRVSFLFNLPNSRYRQED